MSDEHGNSQKRSWRDGLIRARDAMRLTPGRRRLLIRVGIVALVLVALVGVPGYIGSQPGFLQRYSYLDGEYASWSTSVHAKVACQQCHAAPDLPAQAAYSARMLGEAYLSVVMPNRKLDVFAKPTNASCSSCHIDLRTVSPSGDLNIPHRAHVSVLKLDCVRCHTYLVHTKSSDGKHVPPMAACLTCHDGKQAKNACATCHTAKAAPASHRAADWVVVHPDKQQGGECAKCHKWRADWCAECHSKRPRSHVAKWRSTHGEKVKTHRNCEACHDAAFCVRCHGELPKQNFNPALRVVK
ncbi:MAG: cytochrome c3 family protein [Coriobacteriia bacterium]|nr:cytochrome c3 family protein [Coriobacteriia bacterium]